MKKKLLAILLTVCMVLSMAPAALAADSVFTDVKADDWFSEEVKYVYDNGLMNGVGDNTFDPSGTVTRAMVWTTLARQDGVNTAGSDPWWLAGQKWAMENGISDGTMATENITREQLVTMIWRYAKYIDMDVSEGENTNILSYTDALDVNEWAISAMQWACAVGIINGIDGTLQPQGDASRAMLAAILYRFVEEVMPEEEEPEPSTPVVPSYPSIPVHFHSWTAGTPVLPTCSSEGYTPYTCGCGASKNDDFVPAVSHVAGEKCSHCGVIEVETAEQLAAALSADTENINVVLRNDIEVPVASLSQYGQTPGSGEYKLGGESTTAIIIDLNEHKLTLTTSYMTAIGAKNDDATITIKNGSMNGTGNSQTTWNIYDLIFANCNYVFEGVTFEKEVALCNTGKTVTMNDVTINGTGDYYALWIQAEGQTVNIDGLTVNTTGRGIKIDEQYVSAEDLAKVTMNVSEAEFTTAKKAAIMVKSAAGADITLSNVDISAVAADTVNEVWIDEDAAAYQQLVTVTGGNKILEGAVAKIGDMYYSTLQEAVDAAVDGDTVTLLENITEDVTVTQKPDVKFTIDGANKELAGVIVVDGKSGTYLTAGLTIKNVVFKADSISEDACINLGDGTNATRYTCNVTVEGCTFDVPGAVGVKSYTGGDKNLTITDCTVTANGHSLVQAKGIDGVKVEKCKVYSKNGMNFNNSDNVIVTECEADVKGYAVRFGESSGGAGAAETYKIEKSTLKSACDDGDAVIILRGTADYATLNVNETTITGSVEIKNTATDAKVYIDGVLQKAAATQDDLNSAVSGSNTEVEVDLAAGSYTMPTTSGDVTISGTKDTVISGNTCTADNVTFNGVTIQSTGAAYTGIQHSDEVVYNDVTIIGNMYLYAEKVVFNNCTFDLSATNDYIWVYGATNVEFINCTFNTMGKAILVFQDGSAVDQIVKVEGCTFNASESKTTWNGIHVAAVSIDGSQGGTYNVILNNNTVDSDFNGLWQDKTNAGTITVTVDGSKVLEPNS